MTTGLLRSWERRSHCQNNFENAVHRRSRWKRSLAALRCDSERWFISTSVSISTIVHYRGLSLTIAAQRSAAVVEMPFNTTTLMSVFIGSVATAYM